MPSLYGHESRSHDRSNVVSCPVRDALNCLCLCEPTLWLATLRRSTPTNRRAVDTRAPRQTLQPTGPMPALLPMRRNHGIGPMPHGVHQLVHRVVVHTARRSPCCPTPRSAPPCHGPDLNVHRCTAVPSHSLHLPSVHTATHEGAVVRWASVRPIHDRASRMPSRA